MASNVVSSSTTPTPPPTELSLYERDTFLRMCGEKLGWQDMSRHVVMDVGCGDGTSSTNIMRLYPDIMHVVAIDYDKEKVERARLVNPHPYIEYRFADIAKRHTIARWEDQITKVISVYCLQYSRDQKTAIRHIYHLLREEGEAAILFCLQSGFYDWFNEITNHPRWNAYTKGIYTQNPESHEKEYGADHYKAIFEEVGFTIILCQEDRSTYTYTNDAELKTVIFASCPMTINIPSALMEEFQEDLYQAFLKHNRRDNLGRPCVWSINLIALLQKVPRKKMPTTEV